MLVLDIPEPRCWAEQMTQAAGGSPGGRRGVLSRFPAAARGPDKDRTSTGFSAGVGRGVPGLGSSRSPQQLALGPARTYALKAAAGGPVTWRTVGRKLAAGGRAVAGTTGDHTE